MNGGMARDGKRNQHHKKKLQFRGNKGEEIEDKGEESEGKRWRRNDKGMVDR